MASFLLVSGGPNGSWIWDAIKGHLEDVQRRQLLLFHQQYATEKVLAPELPGHGYSFRNTGPPGVTFDECVQSLVDAARELSSPVLVAHSLAGHMALETARRLPSRPRKLILVGAVVPEPPKSVLESLPITTLLLLNALRLLPGNPSGAVRLHREVALKLLCNTLEYPQGASVLGRLAPLPLKPYEAWPFWETLQVPCPVTYVVLTKDLFLYPPLQRRMAGFLPNAKVVELEADHEAPASNPMGVLQVLLQEAGGKVLSAA